MMSARKDDKLFRNIRICEHANKYVATIKLAVQIRYNRDASDIDLIIAETGLSGRHKRIRFHIYPPPPPPPPCVSSDMNCDNETGWLFQDAAQHAGQT
eukprot:1222823-Amphidinium_carterae.1